MTNYDFQDLVEESPNPIFRVGLDGIIQYSNAACKPLFAHCGCQVGGECPPFLYEDSTRTRVEEIKMESSTYILQINPCFDKGYISVFARDISEQKRAENTLNESKAKYEMLVEEANDIIYWANNKGEFTYANPEAQRVLKLNSGDIEGKHFTYPIRDDWKEKTKDFYEKQLMEGKEISYYEFPVSDSDGNETWLGQNVKIIEFDGRIKGFHAVARNITERKRMEKSLSEAKEKAEISLKTQEQFLANMSHEIRTPMNGILGMTKLLSKIKLSKKNSGYLSSIYSSAKHLLSIINDLLDLSKIEAGKMELESTGLKISEIVDNVSTTAQYSTAQKNVFVINEIDESLTDKVFLGDPVRLSQVLTNIVGNAIKFTEDGEVKISAKLISRNENKNLIRFTIKDTGIGIPEDKLGTIFESFKQADNNTTRKYGGTGLGLSICNQLVDLMDGEISLKSEVGVGTTFNVDLSFEEGDSSNLPHNETTVRYTLDNVKVLLVEDNPVNQVYATSILENEKAIVDLAGNGKISIDKLLADEYDIVLMDGQMPEMGGLEAVDIIRNKLKMDVPIIALTANALIGERDKYLARGMNEYVPKPFEDTDLINAIGRVLSLPEKPIQSSMSQKEEVPQPIKSLDLTKLKMVSGDDSQFVDHMIGIFLEEIPKSIDLLSQHISAHDYEGIRFIAHDMKSSLDLLGLNLLEDLQEMEDLAFKEDKFNRIKSLSDIVIDTCNAALIALQDTLSTKST